MSSPIDVLAIAAHPDDVEQTCAGTLIRMAEQGYRTGVLDLTAGEMGTRGSEEERAAEAAAAAKEMLLAERHNLHLPDAKLENTLEARLAIAQKIRDLRPHVVILPYWQAPSSRSLSLLAVRIRGVFPGGPQESGPRGRTPPAGEDCLRFALR